MKTRPLPEVHNDRLMPFRWRELDGCVLLTNDAGDFLWLERDVFGDFMGGTLPEERPEWKELERCNLVRTPDAESRLMQRVRQSKSYLFNGPSLHILILTLRCNQSCIYCHASRKPFEATGFDMSLDTARRVLDVAFGSPSQDLTFEFQGGEPTLNFEVLRFVVEEAYRRNESLGKNLYFSLVSNLACLDEEQTSFLVDQGVMVCTSIDGPAPLHDRNRRFGRRSSHRETLARIGAFDKTYVAKGLDPSLAFVNALATVSRSALNQPDAIVDEYVRLGQKVVHLRPLNPFGMGHKVWSREGYTADEFLGFYTRALDHMISLNGQGVEIMEKMASLMLTRILTDRDPNYVDLRSPCGAGIGQLAYNFDGRVYTCDEGRMIGAMGDDLFCIGHVHQHSYADIIRHPGVRSLCVTSCAECQPGCSDCAYVPFCGICPAYNYVMEGDLVARWPSNERCKIQMGILDYLFRRLREPQMDKLFLQWTETRDRSAVYRRLAP